MNKTKCETLKTDLAADTEQIVSVERFFDGNDDPGSIGCNLMEHPGVDVFRNLLTGLLQRSDVQAVYARISELDPGEESWPFTDTVFVVGTISPEELRDILSPLQPDEIDSGETYGLPKAIKQKHKEPVLAAWWD